MDFPFLNENSPLCSAFQQLLFSRGSHFFSTPPHPHKLCIRLFFAPDSLILKAEYLQSLKSNNYHVVGCKNTHIFLLFL